MNRKTLLVIALVAVLGGGGALAYLAGFFDSDPAEVELTDSTASPSSDGGTITDFDGTWTVDNSSGSLSAEPPTSTFAGYRIDEEFAGVGANTAVGRTQDVDGTMTIDGDEITAVDLTIDMTTLRSDKDMRDNTLRDRGLETGRFPTATFKLTEPITVGDAPAEGKVIEADATGDLTLHGVTKQVTIPLKAKWNADTIIVTSSFDVAVADYDIEKPTNMRVVSIADTGKVEMQLLFTKS